MTEEEVLETYNFLISLPEGTRCKHYLSNALQAIYRYRVWEETIISFAEARDIDSIVDLINDDSLWA